MSKDCRTCDYLDHTKNICKDDINFIDLETELPCCRYNKNAKPMELYFDTTYDE